MRRSVTSRRGGVHRCVENDQHGAMADRLRELIDVVLASLDEPANGAALAARVHFSRDHLDRLLAAATGESPVALRRRLLLERAAWQLRTGAATASEAAAAAGYGSPAAFSRAFARAYGAPPSAYAGDIELPAPNGIHFHAPAGLLIPGGRSPSPSDLTDRMVRHHLDRVRELLTVAATLSEAELERPLRPGFVAVWFEGDEPSAALMCERLVYTLDVWVAAMAGEPVPEGGGPWLPRFARAALGFERLAKRIRDEGAFDDAFVDALCEPPQSFTYGGVLAHVLTYGAIRREALASVLVELGADVPSCGDPIVWEAQSLRTRIARNATTS
jgi:AraC family transcriptional regulator